MMSHTCKHGLVAKYSFQMKAFKVGFWTSFKTNFFRIVGTFDVKPCYRWRQKRKLFGVTFFFKNKIHNLQNNVQTCTAKKTVIREKATIRNNTIKILIMFSMDLSIMLLI